MRQPLLWWVTILALIIYASCSENNNQRSAHTEDKKKRSLDNGYNYNMPNFNAFSQASISLGQIPSAFPAFQQSFAPSSPSLSYGVPGNEALPLPRPPHLKNIDMISITNPPALPLFQPARTYNILSQTPSIVMHISQGPAVAFSLPSMNYGPPVPSLSSRSNIDVSSQSLSNALLSQPLNLQTSLTAPIPGAPTLSYGAPAPPPPQINIPAPAPLLSMPSPQYGTPRSLQFSGTQSILGNYPISQPGFAQQQINPEPVQLARVPSGEYGAPRSLSGPGQLPINLQASSPLQRAPSAEYGAPEQPPINLQASGPLQRAPSAEYGVPELNGNPNTLARVPQSDLQGNSHGGEAPLPQPPSPTVKTFRYTNTLPLPSILPGPQKTFGIRKEITVSVPSKQVSVQKGLFSNLGSGLFGGLFKASSG